MYINIIILPLIISIFAGLLGRKCGKGAQIITTSGIFISAILSIIGFFEIAVGNLESVSINMTSWISSEIVQIPLGFYFDSISITMCVVILSISTLVHFYSIDYMASDPWGRE